MQTIALDGGAVELVGALDIDRTATGIVPRRLPAWTRSQIPDVFMDFVVQSPSGVRLRFATDATAVELDVMLTFVHRVPQALPPAVFDLVVDDRLVEQVSSTTGTVLQVDLRHPDDVAIVAGEPTTIRFEGLPAGNKELALWLPQGGSVELRALRVTDGAAVAAPAPTGRPRWVHYGSSISHCLEAASPTATWPAVAARLGAVDLLNLGFGGQCMLDQFVARTIRDEPAALISMKVGINVVNADAMRERAFSPAVHGFIDTVREGHPDTPLLVVSPIHCPSAEDHPGPTVPSEDGRYRTVPGLDELRATCLTLTKARAAIESIVAARRDEGDRNLHYLDGRELFGPDDAGDLPDDLHPNAAGYIRMGERFAALAFGPGAPLAPPL
jgi:hypothetical protein